MIQGGRFTTADGSTSIDEVGAVPKGPTITNEPGVSNIRGTIALARRGGTVSVVVARDDGVTLTVSDEGPGFPPEFRDHAFDEFSRADTARGRVTGGSGLGLAIARGLVRAHRGSIWIPEGAGGRVMFRLPLAPTATPRSRSPERPQPAV